MNMKKKVYISLIFLLLTSLISLLNAQTVEIIVETAPGGQNVQFYKEISGKWYDSVAKSTAPGCTPNIKSRFTEFEVNPPSKARFQPNIPVSGDYEISVTWWRSANCNNAKYIIHHAQGEKVVYLTQDGWGALGTSNANKWISLGVYPLKAGTENYVEVTDEENQGKPDPKNLGRLYCDAMKFTLVKPAQPGVAIPTPVVSTATPTPSALYTTPSPNNLFIRVQPSVATPTPTPPITSLTPFAATKIQWLNNILIAQQRAQQQNKGILAYFYTDTSEECRQFENNTFVDPSLVSYINTNFIPLKFDMKARPKEAYYLGAYRAPTIILYKSDGTPYKRIVGFKDAKTLLNLLK